MSRLPKLGSPSAVLLKFTFGALHLLRTCSKVRPISRHWIRAKRQESGTQVYWLSASEKKGESHEEARYCSFHFIGTLPPSGRHAWAGTAASPGKDPIRLRCRQGRLARRRIPCSTRARRLAGADRSAHRQPRRVRCHRDDQPCASQRLEVEKLSRLPRLR